MTKAAILTSEELRQIEELRQLNPASSIPSYKSDTLKDRIADGITAVVREKY